MIDAYIAEEHLPLGNIKVFARTDAQNPFLKSGFTLMALHKPAERGSGNDMTISLSHGSGLHLLELWRELERLEDLAWAGERPNDKSRNNMQIYKDGKREDGFTPAPNEPWYLDPHASLIGAPRALSATESGTRLSWQEVVDAIWRVYQPLRHFSAQTLKGEATTLQACKAERFVEPVLNTLGKHLLFARWLPHTGNAEQLQHSSFIRFTPTLERYLAACVQHARRNPAEGEISLQDLPRKGAYDLIELNGGMAVVSAHGAFVIDDWRQPQLDDRDVRKEFIRVCKRLCIIEQTSDRLAELYLDVTEQMQAGMPEDQTGRLLDQLADMKLQVSNLWTETLPQSYQHGVLGLRAALERHFGISGRLEQFYESVDRISALLNSYIDLRTNRRVAFLTAYGFPAVLFASFFGFVFQDIPATLFGTGAVNTVVNIPALLIYLGLTVIATGLLAWLQRRANRRRSKGRKKQ